MYLHIYIYMYMYINTHTHIYIHMCIYKYICMYTICIHICKYIHSIYTHTYVYTQTNTYTHVQYTFVHKTYSCVSAAKTSRSSAAFFARCSTSICRRVASASSVKRNTKVYCSWISFSRVAMSVSRALCLKKGEKENWKCIKRVLNFTFEIYHVYL